MLNLQWVIKRPQLEKRSAWISIYLLINSECAFVNFIVQGPSLVWDSRLWNSNVLHSAQTNISSWHCALWRTLSSKCGYMQASDKVERWLGLWTYRFWKNRDTQALEWRDALYWFSDTHMKQDTCLQTALAPCLGMPGCGRTAGNLFIQPSTIRVADCNVSLLWCCLVNKGKSNCLGGCA